tara:strand:- start:5459 stop:5992 length:534 start_codon:yes stop_codon:yes gene_type:complete
MLKERRGAIELSITTIVVVVIGITILTLGLQWITKTMSGISGQTEELQRVSESQILQIFEQTDKSISTVSKTYSVKKGDTLKNLEIYIRNGLGTTYEFSYTILPLAHPPAIQPSEVLSAMSWVKVPTTMGSGEGFSDTVLFNTRDLPLGDYKFQAELTCTPNCNPPDPRHQFIVSII